MGELCRLPESCFRHVLTVHTNTSLSHVLAERVPMTLILKPTNTGILCTMYIHSKLFGLGGGGG